MSADDRKDKLQLLAMLSDIHSRLSQGRSIHPKAQDIFGPKPEDAVGRQLAPTVTEYIGGVLSEMKAEDLLHAELK